jgi:hypothetical protein
MITGGCILVPPFWSGKECPYPWSTDLAGTNDPYNSQFRQT